eukprot:s1389_g25.t1
MNFTNWWFPQHNFLKENDAADDPPFLSPNCQCSMATCAPCRLPRQEAFRGKPSEVSLISWNVLAPCYVTSSELRYVHVEPSALDWTRRCDLIVEELHQAAADLVLLQEVAHEQFEELEARLGSLGYSCVMQRQRAKGKDHPTGNASFFFTERFELCWEDHRSRILLLDLRDKLNNDIELCVANCHLEGDPHQPMARVAQVRSALQEAARRGGPRGHALVLVGDMNAPLISSAVASYLSFGSVVPGVSEFGMLVDVGKISAESGHPYSMTSAYTPDPHEFSFTLRGAAGHCHMLDQIWFDSTRCHCQALRNLFRSDEHKLAVLNRGLPHAEDPSDHLPVGVILKVAPPSAPAEEVIPERVSAELDLLKEAEELWEACPLPPEQRWQYLRCEEALREATPAGKPSAEELAVYEAAQRALRSLLESLPEECQQILQRVEELKKQARKAAKRSAKDKGKDPVAKNVRLFVICHPSKPFRVNLLRRAAVSATLQLCSRNHWQLLTCPFCGSRVHFFKAKHKDFAHISTWHLISQFEESRRAAV